MEQAAQDQRKIEELGPVNLAAIEELSSERERSGYHQPGARSRAGHHHAEARFAV